MESHLARVRLVRTVGKGLIVVGFLAASAFLANAAVAVGLKALAIYVGALLAAWTFAALALPLLFGVITPGELLASFRARRSQARHHEGDALPVRLGILGRRKPDRIIEADAGTVRATAAPFAFQQQD